MKSFWTSFAFTLIAITSFCQTGTEDDVVIQLRKIIASSEENFKTLTSGKGKKVDTNLQFESAIKIKNTSGHSISISADEKSATYIIPVNNSLNKEQTTGLYKRWSKYVSAAINTKFQRSCSPINLGDVAKGEQCDYLIDEKTYTITITLANIYSEDTDTNSLDLFIRKELK